VRELCEKPFGAAAAPFGPVASMVIPLFSEPGGASVRLVARRVEREGLVVVASSEILSSSSSRRERFVLSVVFQHRGARRFVVFGECAPRPAQRRSVEEMVSPDGGRAR
jgi:hypothetical protein